MPERTKGKYQIGCRVFDVWGTNDTWYNIDITTEDGTRTTQLTLQSREHWLLLADLCLRLAEHSSKFSPSPLTYTPRIPRKEIRQARKLLRTLVSESKRALEDAENCYGKSDKVGWLKED